MPERRIAADREARSTPRKYEAAHFAKKCAAHCTYINCVSGKSDFRILGVLVGHGTLCLSLRENVAVLCP